jgi:oligoendopeptidase F
MTLDIKIGKCPDRLEEMAPPPCPKATSSLLNSFVNFSVDGQCLESELSEYHTTFHICIIPHISFHINLYIYLYSRGKIIALMR